MPRSSCTTWRLDEAVTLLREMGRVARLGVVVNDLDRSRLGWVGAWLIGHLLTGNRYTRHDAPLSVERAYRPDEMAGMLREAGLRPVRVLRGAFGQRYAIAAVPAPEGDDPSCAARSDGRRRVTARPVERVEVAIVGGGPAGAVLAARLAEQGREVVVLERSLAWHWRAGGVFTSPAAVAALRSAGFDPAILATVARPIPAMRVETASGTTFRLTYGADTGGECAVGFDRSRLDPALLGWAAADGADVRRGWHVTGADLEAGTLDARDPDARPVTLRASVIVGADGLHSVVARAAGVARPARLPPRVGLTYHLPDPDPTAVRDARMRVFRDGYVGIAPVAGGRVNVGIVLGRSWREALVRDGARAVVDSIVAAIPPTDEDPATWRAGNPRTRSPAPGRSGIG